MKSFSEDFLPLYHLLRTKSEAQANISKSWGKDILWMTDVSTDTVMIAVKKHGTFY